MSNCITVKEALKIAERTGQQVTLILKSGRKLDGVIVEKLWATACRVWLDPCECFKHGGDIDKAIVSIDAVDYVDFTPCNPSPCIPMVNQCDLGIEGIREALCDAEIIREPVKIGLNIDGCSILIVGCVKSVSCNTCCIKIPECCQIETIKICQIEFVKFS